MHVGEQHAELVANRSCKDMVCGEGVNSELVANRSCTIVYR
jgi:hypothetical protein